MVGGIPLPDEADDLAEQAAESRQLSPAQRTEMFASIMKVIQGIWASLPPEEQWRRIRIGEELEPSACPWWLALPPHARP